MGSDFSRSLSLLRQEKGISQRSAARDLGISQALLSHYENGIREPGLAFVVRACDYYQVSADDLLGRQGEGRRPTPAPEEEAAAFLADLCRELCRRSPEQETLLRCLAGELAQPEDPKKSRAVKA